MSKGYILGYDINERNCQISYFDETQDEPETMQVSSDNYQIPLAIGYFQNRWIYGREAKRLSIIGVAEDYVATDLLNKAVAREKVELAGKTYDAVWLLTKFISLTLQEFEDIRYLAFSITETNVDLSKMFKAIGNHLGISKDCICVQDYKESFCQYMIFQPKELWQYEASMFYCDDEKIKAYMLRKLRVDVTHNTVSFVTVDEVVNAKRSEMEALYPVIGEKKSPDESFKAMIENIFEKKVISSVYLTGPGFEKNWYPNSLRVLCNGRRAFMGNNLYSKGACYTAIRNCKEVDDGPVYLDETKLTDRICLRMRVDGQEGWYPLVAWGTHWYEADGRWEVLLEDTSDIEILVESLVGDDMQVERVSLEGLPNRTDYSLRLQVETMFMDERTCKVTFKDIGFGEFYPATDFEVEKLITLGGIHGQFNSMS